ncbi:MAG: VanZ family protein [Candidatus Moranbacteria bacterium]|nr:VanZ family protein [Candidatus Moranbacteria bacterium]
MKRKTKIISVQNFFWYYAPLLIWIGIIWLLSSQEGTLAREAPQWSFYVQRKGAHIVEFFVLTFLFWRVIRLFTKNSLDTLVWTFIWVLWMATLDESHQSLVMGREGKVSDVIIDMIGASSALLIIRGKCFLPKNRLFQKICKKQ